MVRRLDFDESRDRFVSEDEAKRTGGEREEF
jgi:hypothetical protein